MNTSHTLDELDAVLRMERRTLVKQAWCVLLLLLMSGVVFGFGFSLGIVLAGRM